jgi:KDO2-lipid IV(A) lauroyltransferase
LNKLLRDALTRLAIAVFWLLSRLPYSWQLALGRRVGRLFLRLSRRRRRIAETNLSLCYPGLNEAQRELLLQQHFEALGMGLFETAQAWWGSARWIEKYVFTEGLDYVRQAQSEQKPVILLSAHFTPVELSLLIDIPAARLTYRPHENPTLNAIIAHNRQRRGKQTIARTDIRQMLRILKDGGVVWIAPDQSYSGKTAVSAPFFGIPAATTSLISVLAKRTGAVIVPFFVYRQAAARYALKLCEPLRNLAELDEVEAATEVNQIIESMISCAPEQYFWVHRRFKNNPAYYE